VTPLYRRTQPGVLLVTMLLLGIATTGAIWLWSGRHLVPAIVAALLLVLLVIFRSLTIEIDGDELRCYFGDGLIRRRFPLADIVSATAVRNRWYHGWGIRLTPTGWMFNVSGLDAVELTLSNGKRFRIGTDDPGPVIEALERARRPS
jgi:hypothetical protein